MKRRSKTGSKTSKAGRYKAATPKPTISPNAVPGRRSRPSGQTEIARFIRERDEALQQQAATSEVLRIISNSPGDLELIFRSILVTANRICEAHFGTIFRYDGKALVVTAWHGVPPEYLALVQSAPILVNERTAIATATGRAAKSKQVIHIADISTELVRTEGGELRARLVELGGVRTILAVPMLKDAELIGVFTIYRQEVRPFTDKQIELLKSFAAQAVIAIENARLLNELRQRTDELSQRTDDLSEALEQQTATSEVLKVISSSPGELLPVFQAMLGNAVRICQAKFGVMFQFEADESYAVARLNLPPAVEEFFQQRGRIKPTPGSDLDRLREVKQVIHTEDMAAAPFPSRIAKLAFVRTQIAVPMVKDQELVGAIMIYRQEVRPFTDKQIALVQNFAAQAVIAIENARLLNELRELLEQQTATSEVLSVISGSPGDLQPVFRAMLENAVRICGAQFGNLALFDGNEMRAAAMYNAPTEYEALRRSDPTIPRARSIMGPLVESKAVVHIHDLAADAHLANSMLAKAARARTALAVPMLHDDNLVGAIALYSQEVRPFTEKQIELLKNFAAQAVIAIENARLLNELRQRTDDLMESLEQQTATSEVLRIVATSPQSVQPVFNAIVANAARLCEATFSAVAQFDGELLHLVAVSKMSPEETTAYHTVFPRRPNRTFIMGRAFVDGKPVHVEDIETDLDYDPNTLSVLKAAAPYRTYLGIPILRDGVPIGVIGCGRREVRPFTEAQIALVENFAAQAVIAIENARLLNELRQRTGDLTELLEQQTATSDVLKVISSSPGDLEPVFQAMLVNAIRMCAAKFGMLYRYDGHSFTLAAHIGAGPRLLELMQGRPFTPHPDTVLGRLHATNDIVAIADATQDRAYLERNPVFVAGVEEDGTRGLLGVPMLQDNKLVGAFVVFRQVAGPFTDKQVELVQNFAAQAVIAIENTRLLNELRQRTEDLSKSLDDLRTAQDRLVQTQKLASLGQLTAGIAHEIKNPLNFVNNFSALSVELLDELQEAVESGAFDDKRRTEITELTNTLRGNLDKIAQHGKRADAIVKNMLLHSREGSGEQRAVDINAIVEESLNLAYHGARAETQGFNITLQRSFDPDAGQAELYPQEISRALLNFISNGFYAATKRQREIGDGYEPTLVAATKNLGARVEIRICDNGTGVTSEVKEKMFNPFFTTKPAGEGTGLGLSISHDIIVKQHSGSIEVDSAPGEFTEIRIVLPRTTSLSSEPGG